jgi:hypothetical protein
MSHVVLSKWLIGTNTEGLDTATLERLLPPLPFIGTQEAVGSCGVVSSNSKLLGSGLGDRIDRHEVVCLPAVRGLVFIEVEIEVFIEMLNLGSRLATSLSFPSTSLDIPLCSRNPKWQANGGCTTGVTVQRCANRGV